MVATSWLKIFYFILFQVMQMFLWFSFYLFKQIWKDINIII